MRYRVLFLHLLLLACLAGWSAVCLADVVVSVEGVEDRLHKNIMARLRLHLFSRDSELTGAEIRRLHRQAAEDIKSALAPYGYYNVTVTSSLEREEDLWKAEYRVDPGKRVRIDSVSVSVAGPGAALPEFANAARFLPLQSGDPLDQPRYEAGKRALLRSARAIGFLDATYSRQEIRVDRNSATADIELVLDSGPRFLFGDIHSQQQIISPELLQRFVPFSTGDHYSSGKLYELQRDLYRTDFFSLVTVEPDRADDGALHVPVNIILQPRENYNRYSFGVGYATDTRAYLKFEWQNRLLNRSGHRAFSSFLVGEQESRCLINYRVPIADPRYNTLAGTGQWTRELWEDTITNALSAGVAYEYSTPRYYFGLSAEVLDEDYRVGETKGDAVLVMPGVHGSLAIADDLVNTENGLRASVKIIGASETMFSDASFIKVRGDGKLILSPVENYRLIGRGSAGVILVDSIDDIPPSLRFYAGGSKSVRGYRYRTLGPQDSSGTVIGGRYLLTGSIECERRLSEYFRAAIYYDVGNAMDDPTVDLVHGVGLGVGLALPFGQARLDLAYPLDNDGSSQFVFISVGADL